MRRMVSILGREGDFEPGEFGLKFIFSGFGDEGQSTKVLTATNELTISKSLGAFDESSPALGDCNFSSHKV